MTRTNEKRPGRFRIGMAGATIVVIGATAALGGCSEVPDYLNPVEWYNSTVDYVAGDGKGDAADARTQAAATQGAGADQPMPKLGDTPERPNVDAAKTSREIRQGLVADTTGRKYAPAIQRQGAAQSVLVDEPKPTVAAAPEAPQAVPEAPKPVASATPSAAPAPAKPMPAMPAPMTAGSPPAPPAIAQVAKAPSAAPQQPAPQPAMPQFAPPAPPANAMMGAADSFETVVVSSDGVHRTSNWGQGAKAAPAPAAVAMAPSAPMGGQYVASGQTLKVATIQFRDGSSGLDDRDTVILRQVLQLQKERGGRIRIVGHASSRTRDMDPVRHKMVNYQISVDRAETVAKKFLAMGVPNQDLVVVAKADAEPLYYEIMPSGEAGNRRTEIYLDF